MIQHVGMAGKVALVTGGSSGIGRAIALAFSKAGAKVAIIARGKERGEAAALEIRDAGGEAIFISADIGDPDNVKTMVDNAVQHFGRLDYAVNNATASADEMGSMAPLTDIPIEAWNRTIDVNLRAVWLGMKYQIAEMLKIGGGSIVNISSAAGRKGIPGLSPYVAAKFGVNGITKSASMEFAKNNIRVNAILPGPVATATVEELELKSPGYKDLLTSFVPIGRMGTPEEIALATVWLCSDAASFITGIDFAIDGGMLEK